MSEIGKFIKEKREEANFSQEQLAKACGLQHDSTLCKIENGTRNVKWEELGNIAKALGNFHIFEALLVAGFITEEDIHPIHRIHSLDKLNEEDIGEVQQFVNFLIYKKSSSEERGQRHAV